MNDYNKKPSLMRIAFFQILFIGGYWFVIWAVMHSLDGIVYHKQIVYKDLDLCWWIQMAIRWAMRTWAAFAIGITPYIVGAIWCHDNQYFMDMVKNLPLVKIMKVVIAIECGLLMLYATCWRTETDWDLMFLVAVLISLFIWFFYIFSWKHATRTLEIRKGENRAEWIRRIGEVAKYELFSAGLPVFSVSIAMLCAMWIFIFFVMQSLHV